MNLILLVFGLCVGSFLAALTYRYPRGISILSGRSKCDFCGAKISWFDNIPVLSYLFLGGRCRSCKKHFSLRYPLIELGAGLGFVIIGLNIVPLLLFCVLISIFILDLENQIIPDSFVFIGILIASLNLLIFPLPGQALYGALFAGFISAAFLVMLFLITRGRGMGLGDVKFAILGGMLVGLKLTFVWFFVAFLTGAIVGIILILTRSAKLKDKIAFGPFLVFAIPVALVWGQKLYEIFYR